MHPPPVLDHLPIPQELHVVLAMLPLPVPAVHGTQDKFVAFVLRGQGKHPVDPAVGATNPDGHAVHVVLGVKMTPDADTLGAPTTEDGNEFGGHVEHSSAPGCELTSPGPHMRQPTVPDAGAIGITIVVGGDQVCADPLDAAVEPLEVLNRMPENSQLHVLPAPPNSEMAELATIVVFPATSATDALRAESWQQSCRATTNTDCTRVGNAKRILNQATTSAPELVYMVSTRLSFAPPNHCAALHACTKGTSVLTSEEEDEEEALPSPPRCMLFCHASVQLSTLEAEATPPLLARATLTPE